MLTSKSNGMVILAIIVLVVAMLLNNILFFYHKNGFLEFVAFTPAWPKPWTPPKFGNGSEEVTLAGLCRAPGLQGFPLLLKVICGVTA